MTPIEALALIQSQPHTLSTGQSLQHWLARETPLAQTAHPLRSLNTNASLPSPLAQHRQKSLFPGR